MIETEKDIGDKAPDVVTRWTKEIDLASSHEKKWRERSEKVIKRFRDERDENDSSTRFNILYSNVEVLKAVVYAQKPVPDVRRRFLDADPVGKVAAQVLTRSLAYSIDAYDFNHVMLAVVEDVLLPGRGLATVKYVPTYESVPVQPDEMGAYPPDAEIAKDGTATMQQVVYEEALCEYIDWEMVRISPAKRWDKVRWIAFGELLTRAELKAQFPKFGSDVKLDWKPKGHEEGKEDDFFKRALVWKIWNKQDRKLYVISKGYTQSPLAVIDDPLKLEGFWPCPRPIYAISTTNSMIPIPEYTQYQDQARELDEVTERITALVDALRRRGVFDSSQPELEKLATADDNKFVPVENLAALMEKGGLQNIIMELPIEGIAKVLLQLYAQRDQIKATIYEVTGISDVVRGATNPNETLGAQQLKSRYGSIRVQPRQAEVQRFARDLLRLKAEIMSEHFSPQTLSLMVGRPVPEEVIQLLKNDKLRGFRVDIETDSTIQPDADTEQKNRIDLLTAVTGFVEKIGPAVQQGAIPMEVAKELLMFGVRAFKVGPQIEETLENMGKQQNQPSQKETELQQQLQAMQQENEQGKQMLQEANAKAQQVDQIKAQDQIKQQFTAAQEQISQAEAKLAEEQRAFEYDKKIYEMTKQLDAFEEYQSDEAAKQRESQVNTAQQDVQSIAETVRFLGESLTQVIEQMQGGFEAVGEVVTNISAQVQQVAAESTKKPTRIQRVKKDGRMIKAIMHYEDGSTREAAIDG